MNQNYWGEKPKVKQFVVKTIPDMESRIMALRSGEIDMIFGVNNITYDYNIEKAKELLDNAGWIEVEGSNVREKEGQKLEAEILYESGKGVDKDMALIMAEQLKKVGFNVVKLTGSDLMTCMGRSMGGDFQIYSARSYGVPYEPYLEISAMNKISWHNPAQQGLSEKEELDLKINKVSSMTDKEEIQKTYSYILTTLHDEALYIPISYKKELAIFNKEKIKDYKFSGQPLNIDISGIVAK